MKGEERKGFRLTQVPTKFPVMVKFSVLQLHMIKHFICADFRLADVQGLTRLIWFTRGVALSLLII